MDRFKAQLMDHDIQKALVDVGEKHGVKITVDPGRFYPGEYYEPKVRATVLTDGDYVSHELKMLYRQHPSVKGKRFVDSQLGVVEPHGYHTSRPKYPYTVKQVTTGKIYRVSRFHFEMLLSKEAQAA